MTRRLRVHNGVEDDLSEAFSYYANEAPEQINRLYDLFLDAITKRIPQVPNAYAPLFWQLSAPALGERARSY